MKFPDTTITRLIMTILSFGFAFGFYNLSVDRGNLWWYLFTLVFVYLGFSNLFKLLDKTLWKEEKLNNLRTEIEKDNPSPELKAQAINLVFGDGSIDADILFIGEAPGKNEDESGLPFIGRAGKFLNEMLDKINLSRNDVYITNIVKYRPLNNRDPLDAEKEAFLPYLIRQINIIKPKLIITLGRHSMNCFLPEHKISESHGKLNSINFKYQDKEYKYNILPMFHPAAAIYNQSLKSSLIEDFLTIPQILSELTTK